MPYISRWLIGHYRDRIIEVATQAAEARADARGATGERRTAIIQRTKRAHVVGISLGMDVAERLIVAGLTGLLVPVLPTPGSPPPWGDLGQLVKDGFHIAGEIGEIQDVRQAIRAGRDALTEEVTARLDADAASIDGDQPVVAQSVKQSFVTDNPVADIKKPKKPKTHKKKHKHRNYKSSPSRPKPARWKSTIRTISSDLPPYVKVIGIAVVVIGGVTVVVLIVLREVRRHRANRVQSDDEQVVSSPDEPSTVINDEEENLQGEANEDTDLYIWMEQKASDATESS